MSTADSIMDLRKEDAAVHDRLSGVAVQLDAINGEVALLNAQMTANCCKPCCVHTIPSSIPLAPVDYAYTFNLDTMVDCWRDDTLNAPSLKDATTGELVVPSSGNRQVRSFSNMNWIDGDNLTFGFTSSLGAGDVDLEAWNGSSWDSLGAMNENTPNAIVLNSGFYASGMILALSAGADRLITSLTITKP